MAESPEARQLHRWSRDWLEGRMKTLEEDLLSREQKVRDLGMEITRHWRDIVALRRELRNLRQVLDNRRVNDEEELSRLHAMPGFREVRLGSGCLVLDTESIVLQHQGRRHIIGEFRLEIYLNGFLRMQNRGNRGRYPYYDHPHIRDGLPCIGNHTEAVAKLISEGQISTVAAILLSFLRTYNPEDAYCEIACWPELSDGA